MWLWNTYQTFIRVGFTHKHTHVFITTCIFILVTIGTTGLLECGGGPPLLFKRWKEIQKPYWESGNMASEFTLLFSTFFFSYISRNKIRGNIKIKKESQFIQFRKRGSYDRFSAGRYKATNRAFICCSKVEVLFGQLLSLSNFQTWFSAATLLIITGYLKAAIYRCSYIPMPPSF
jgi:hypothetical protein